MTIKTKNLEILDYIEDKLTQARFDFIERTLTQSTDSIKEYRSLQITILGLSVAIAGIVIPLLVANNIQDSLTKDLFFISTILFGFNIIWGVIGNSIQLSNESGNLWKNSDIKIKEMDILTEKVREIRRIEDNDTAGKALLKLRQDVDDQIKKNKQKRTIWDYIIDIFFFSLFVSANLFTFVGLIRILYL